ncbi:MAG: NUDIX domain-containing protein [Oscillospiraceae bacterium]|nr:NUDIX domain-containing protein [Oscillospiraceae bacterium]
MLGRYVRVRVTDPMHSYDSEKNLTFDLNYGVVESGLDPHSPVRGAYIMGVTHAVRVFEGRVVAVIKRKNMDGIVIVVAPKSKRYIVHTIEDAVAFAEPLGSYDINCLYESSCGAVVYRIINNEVRFLLIKNKRSLIWGFPKGHMERGERERETAYREVLEEAGIRIRILPDFRQKSEYVLQNRIEKRVIIFLATTEDTHTVIQREEVDDYVWANFDSAMNTLKFPNDRRILKKAQEYLDNAKII